MPTFHGSDFVVIGDQRPQLGYAPDAQGSPELVARNIQHLRSGDTPERWPHPHPIAAISGMGRRQRREHSGGIQALARQ